MLHNDVLIVKNYWPSAALLSVLICSLSNAESQQPNPFFNQAGYRTSHYRSPTPASVIGGDVISTTALRHLIQFKNPEPILINVLPLDAFQGVYTQASSEPQIPSSYWLANVGKGDINTLWMEYFQHHLKVLRGQRPEAPIVFYCKADCWMSWNAVTRAHSLGHHNLYWYAEGIDGWREADFPLVLGRPEPIAPFL
jgi:PQQ-dependent catabolism-associated CXXCW motif protein